MCRLPGPASRATGGDRRRPSHRRARQDMAPCRPETRGGQVDHGEPGHASHDRDHSGQHRHGPTCQPDQAALWLDDPTRRRRPVPHVLVPLTLPVARSALARRPQPPRSTRRCRSAAAALPALAWAPRGIGGRSARVGGLHPWPRALRSHPPVPSRAAGGGRSAEGPWRSARPAVLVHVTPRAVIVRATCRAPRPTTDLCPRVDDAVWHQAGVVPCAPVGTGQDACTSRAPDRLRGAIGHHRLRTREDAQVTLQDKASAPEQVRIWTVTAAACLRRFLPHGRPDRCINGRADGFLRPGNRQVRTSIHARLGARTVAPHTPGTPPAVNDPPHTRAARRCPPWGRLLIRGATLRPQRRWPP